MTLADLHTDPIAELQPMAARPFDQAVAMQGNSAFRRQDYCLPAIRCEEWLGWVHVTLNNEAEPVATRLAPLAALITRYGLEDYAETFRETHVWDTNWRILAEVNTEDRGCTEAVFRGASAGLAPAGHLSHPERPIYDFAGYVAGRTG